MIKTLTIFTPTYNRAGCLGELYASLLRQTSDDFLWLIIDDGSTDNTSELVRVWQDNQKIEIKYIYKENGGMHTAHNLAYTNINTEINVCIDSDDFMPDDAVEKIVMSWRVADKGLAGIIGLDADRNGKIIGSTIPKNIKTAALHDLYEQYGVSGDKKVILRTELVKKYLPAYPEYVDSGERLVPLGSLYLRIGQQYQWKCENEVYCIVEYLVDGSSYNIMKQYRNSPRGFSYMRQLQMMYTRSKKVKFKSAVHLVSSFLFTWDFSLLRNASSRLYIILAFVPGVLLNLYIRTK